MAPTPHHLRFKARRPRVGVVLGAGGVLGAAWMAGVLPALQERLGRPLQDVDLIVGTSAGSVLAAALRCGVEVEAIVAHQRGIADVSLPHLAEFDRESGRRPPLPRLGFGSTRLLVNVARAPHRVHPWVAASALVPPGRVQARSLTNLVQALLTNSAAGASPAAPAWPREHTWIVAIDYDSGRRVAFGRAGAPAVPLPDAVVASCSIPGWYAPRVIGDRRYVDGGVRSSTSLDLLARVELDEVYVLAPMASFDCDRPRNPVVRAERLFRRLTTRRLVNEVHKVEATGTRVIVLAPGRDDLAAMGVNLMDPARRQRVLETSLRTSAPRLASLHPHVSAA
jgi:NTE family protein